MSIVVIQYTSILQMTFLGQDFNTHVISRADTCINNNLHSFVNSVFSVRTLTALIDSPLLQIKNILIYE